METKPAEKVKQQIKLPTTWSILPTEIEMASVTSSQEEELPVQVGSADDPLPGGVEQSPKTINASGNSKEERSINMLTGSESNNVIETHQQIM